MNAVSKAYYAIQDARAAWAAEMEKAVPVGAEVQVYIGAHVHRIKITRFYTLSYCEGEVGGINVKTGVGRKFHFTQIIGYPFSRYNENGHMGWVAEGGAA